MIQSFGERVSEPEIKFFATGFLGGYTTFSSYTWEALSLAQTGARARAAAYVLCSNLLGLGVFMGATLAQVIPS